MSREHGPKRGVLIASIFVVLLFLALLVTALLCWRQQQECPTPTYATAAGERRVVLLEDGTRVYLNERTGINVSFDAQARGIQLLDGEILIRGAEDTRRPLRVHTRTAVAGTFGATFAVRADDSTSTALVVTGEVQVCAIPACNQLPPTDTAAERSPRLPPRNAPARLSERMTAEIRHDGFAEVVAYRRLQPQELARELAWAEGL